MQNINVILLNIKMFSHNIVLKLILLEIIIAWRRYADGVNNAMDEYKKNY